MSSTQKLIQSHKATKPTKPVICIETGVEYPSVKEAAKIYGMKCATSIAFCCRGKQRTAGGVHWCFSENYSTNLLEILKKQTKKSLEKPAKAVICVETGQIFRSANQAIQAMVLKKGTHIGECCKGQRPTAGGYHWQFAEDWQQGRENIKPQEKQKRPVLCIETGITYFSALHARKATGIQNGAIGKCCQGKQKKAGGHRWSYT